MLPKTGRVLPKRGKTRGHGGEYASTLAAALHEDVGDSHRAVKTIMRWTGASERTVKNWLAGTTGPCGEHLVLLAHHSDLVFEVFLLLAERDHALASTKLVQARNTLADVLSTIELLLDDSKKT